MNKPNVESNQTGSRSANESTRRRFVRGVGVAIPVALTVASRSSLASQCFSPSANASLSALNASRTDRLADGICIGQGPAYWATPNSPVPLNNPKFKDVFAGNGPANLTMRDVAATGNSFQQHMAAAWCNVNSSPPLVPSNVLDQATLILMWAGKNGTYKPIPTGTVVWDRTQIQAYLATTWS